MEFKAEALRPGQRDALQIIEQRVERGKDTTAIVLPCRYGKSDVIRVASLKMWSEGTASAFFALSPNVVLRSQIADAERWDAAMLRYGIRLPTAPKISQLDQVKMPLAPNDEMFLSMTTHLASNHREILAQWIEREVRRTRLPVLVFVDECHTGSEDNKWGDVVPTFIKAGAHVVLLTATAERSDGRRIPGFRFEAAGGEDITIYRTSAGSRPELVRVDVLNGFKTQLRLVPDKEVTFAEAWDMDGTLCKVARNPFDVDLRTMKGVNEDHKWLSELSPSRSRELLGRVVREPMVMAEGCKRLVASLTARRRFQPDVKAIVYCGNDKEDSGQNAHPREIKQAIKKINPSLDVVIATSAEGDGETTIKRFIDGHGDVLIVKQMAGIGLDIPRLKIGLDLSPTRTFASFVQRMMRPATPYGAITAMEWISPDDVLSAAHFEKLVASQGGEASATDLAVVDTYEKEKGEPDGPLTLFTEGVGPGDFDDSASNRASREHWDPISRLLEVFPMLLMQNTHAELAATLAVSNLEIVQREQPAVATQDTSVAADAVRADLNRLVKELTNWRMKRWGADRSQYGRETEQTWADAKIASQWPQNTKLGDTDDLAALDRMRIVLEKQVAEILSGEFDAD